MKYWEDDMMADGPRMPYFEDGMFYHKHYQPEECEPMCQEMPEMVEDECCVPKVSPPTKECVKTYKCCYKLYKICHYKLFKVCPRCGHEFDHHHHQGMCPKCR